jgi:hypothetical protein
MELGFMIGDETGVFRWTSTTGRAEIVVSDNRITLQSPFKLSTHMQFGTRRTRRHVVSGHQIEVIKDRPRMAGGLRPNTFTIVVDGTTVAQGTGT